MRRGLRQGEQVVVALEVARMVAEALAAEVRVAEPLGLDHRAHGAVDDDDPLAQQADEGLGAVRRRAGNRMVTA